MSTPGQRTCSLMAAFCALVVFAGCSAKAKPAAETASGAPIETAILPGSSVGKIEAGMSRSQIIAVLGEPDAGNHGRHTSRVLEYRRGGLVVVLNHRDNIVSVVMCGDSSSADSPLAKAFTGKTPEGIGIGSSRAELIKACGKPDAEDRSRPGHPMLRYKQAGLTFTLGDDKIHHIVVDFRVAE